MAELDLIPAEWRARRALRRGLLRIGAALAVVAFVAVGARVALDRIAALEQARAQSLAQQYDQARGRAEHALHLARERDRVRALVSRIDALRGAPFAVAVLGPLDRALDDAVWFSELAYERDGTTRTAAAEPGPAGAAAASVGRVLVRGAARDHAALARFVGALAAQPVFASVRLTDSQARSYTRAEVIEFSIEIDLAPNSGGQA